jgi:transposase
LRARLTARSGGGISVNVSADASVEPIAAALEAQLVAVTEERDEYKKLVRHLREENERLKRGLLGQKAERLPANDSQLSLMILGLALEAGATAAPPAPAPPQIVASHTRRAPTRKPLPEHLPRVQIEIVPPEVERAPDAFDLIGTESRCVLERRPAATVVLEILYKKYVPKERIRGVETEVLVADALELPIERGIAGPGMLADSIVRRWQDHQPVTRLEGIYAREGLDLSKSTICGWHDQLADLVRPLVDAMFAEALREPLLCTDASGARTSKLAFCRQRRWRRDQHRLCLPACQLSPP